MTSSVAVIIPVHNVTRFLEEAIASVVKQKHPVSEIIVVDDGSNTQAQKDITHICSAYSGVTLIHQPHRGTAAARDTGLAACSAEFIYFLDADDRLRPNAVRYLIRALHKNPKADASYGRYRRIDEHGKFTHKAWPPRSRMVSGREVLRKLLQVKQPFIVGTICIRKSLLEKISVANHPLVFGEDWVLWCHLALTGHIVPAGNRVIQHYRWHDKNSKAEYIKNPEPVFSTYDTIFKNPVFIDAVGKEAMHTLEQHAISRVHMKMASYYAVHGQMEKAQSHMHRMNVPPNQFMESPKKG